MIAEMTEPAAAFRAILGVAVGRIDPRQPFAAGQAFDRVVEALGDTVLGNRLTLRNDRGTSVSIVARDRRVLRVVETQPRSLWAGDLPPAATAFNEDGAEAATTVAELIRRVVDGAGSLTLERGFLPYSAAAGHDGFGIRHLVEAWESRGDDTADPVERLLRDLADLPRATVTNGQVTFDIPAGVSGTDEQWFRTVARQCAETAGATTNQPLLFVFDEASPRALVALPVSGGVVLAMATQAQRIQKIETALTALHGTDRT